MDTDDISVGRVGTPLQGVDIKIVSWNEGGYSVTDQAGARGEIHIGNFFFIGNGNRDHAISSNRGRLERFI